MRPPPTFNDRFLLFLAVLLFGLGIVNTAQGQYGTAYVDFIASGLCFATHR